MDEKINWTLVAVLTVAGAAAIIWGLALEDFDASAFSGLLIEIGAGIGLIGAVVLIERELTSRISTAATKAATTAATETVRDATIDLQERIIRLEDLDQAQQHERSRRRSENDAAIERVRSGELTAESIGELVLAAIDDRLIVDDIFGVRTSDSPDSPVLYFCVRSAPNGVSAIWLDFEPLMLGNDIVEVPDLGEMFVPNKTDSIVMWIYNDTAAQIGDELEAGLERSNTPFNGFNFAYALDQLTKSIETMRAARSSTADSPKRLQGQLVLLVNEHWAITDNGIESLGSRIKIPIVRGISGFIARHARLPNDFDESVPGWEEAEAWLTDRENVSILRDDEEPQNPFAGMVRDDRAEPDTLNVPPDSGS